MSDWDDLRFVLETVRHGGLSGAARAMKVNHATVARRIAAAENQLGARLFDRLASGYTPTEAGQQAAEIAERMEQANHELSRVVAGRDDQLSGPLTITAPQLFIEHVLMEFLPAFHNAHPEIDLRIAASNVELDLDRREADVAFRVSKTPADRLVGRRLTEQKAAVYVGLKQLERMTKSSSAPLDWVRFAHWSKLPESLKENWPNRRISLTVDDMTAAIAAVRAGVGATRMPCLLGDDDPLLRRLPGVPLFDYSPLWILTHPDLRNAPKVSRFMSFAAVQIREMRPRFQGHMPFDKREA